MLADFSANTHAVCRLCSLLLRCEAQECASAAVVRPNMNDCSLPRSVNFSPLSYRVFNKKKAGTAAGGGCVHCVYFTCMMGQEKECKRC